MITYIRRPARQTDITKKTIEARNVKESSAKTPQ